MEIIDAHAHIYPSKIAEKATESVGKFYGINMNVKAGTPEELLSQGKKANISKYIVHSVATKAPQVGAINDFIYAQMQEHPEFIGFMTLHQDLSEEEVYNDVKLAIERGFKGIKLHPDFQKFYIDGEEAYKFYRVVSELNRDFPILFHTGDNRYDFSMPERLIKVAKEFKNLYFIGSHFGGYTRWKDALIYDKSDNVFFDTSSSLAFIDGKTATDIIHGLGAERFFFGTDFPMWNASEELERFMNLKLSDKERENILAKNVKNLLKI